MRMGEYVGILGRVFDVSIGRDGFLLRDLVG